MTRTLFIPLVVAIHVASSGRARADRVACSPPEYVSLPADGAVGVPINAGYWTIRTGVLAPGPVAEQFKARFTPSSNYRLFTTGSETDTVPPAPPRAILVRASTSAATATDWTSTSLSMIGRFDADVAWMELTISGPWGPLSIAATPGRQRFCAMAGVAIPPGDYDGTLRAFDLAGNASGSVPLRLHVRAYTKRAVHNAPQDDDRGVITLVVILGGLMLIVVALAVIPRRSGSAPLEAVPLSVAEAAVKILRLRHAMGAGISAAVTATGFASCTPWLGLAPGVVFLAFVAQLMAEWQALRNARIDRTTATREGRTLILEGPWGRNLLSVSDATFAAAQRGAAPTATLRRDD